MGFQHKIKIVVLIVILGCAQSGFYKDIVWVNPENLGWLQAADEVAGCYKQQMLMLEKNPQPIDFKGVTVTRSTRNHVFGTKEIVLVYARNESSVRHGLARALLYKRRPDILPENHNTVLRIYGLCYGYCVNDEYPEEFKPCDR